MELLAETGELEIFDNESISELINYKWHSHGKCLHYFSAIMHFAVLMSIFLYTHVIYGLNHTKGEEKNALLIFMGICIIYPLVYDTM